MPLDPTALKPVKALFFDVFGTVVDWRQSIVSALDAAFQQAIAAHPDHEPLLRKVGLDQFAQDWRMAYMQYCKAVSAGESPAGSIEEHFRTSLVRLLNERGLGQLFDEQQIANLADSWGRLDAWRDSSQGLRDLQQLGLRTCTLSNGSQRLLASIAAHADLSWSRVCSAEDFGSFKPDPRVYQGAVKAEGLEPGETAMVAAHIRDLVAARRQGMRTIYIERFLEEDVPTDEARRLIDEVVDLGVGVEEGGIEAVARELRRFH